MNSRPGNAWYQKFAPWGDTSPQKVDQDEALVISILRSYDLHSKNGNYFFVTLTLVVRLSCSIQLVASQPI